MFTNQCSGLVDGSVNSSFPNSDFFAENRHQQDGMNKTLVKIYVYEG